VVLHHEGLRHDAEHLARDVERERVDDRQAVLALEIGEELLLGDEPEADEVGRERAAVLALLLQRLGELIGGQITPFLEYLSETRRQKLCLLRRAGEAEASRAVRVSQ
jgi:hypothetical protein